jgi:hypothetical protein
MSTYDPLKYINLPKGYHKRYQVQATEGFRDAAAFIPKTVEGCLCKQIYSAVNNKQARQITFINED